jgi:hypothetical protein
MADFVTSGDEVGASEARRMSRTALEAAERFRLALYRHEADHSCDRPADLHKVPETPPEFQIEPLPLDPAQPRPTVIPELPSQPLFVSPSGPILILANDVSIRNLLCRLLERRGYLGVEIDQTQDLAMELKERSVELVIIHVSNTTDIETAIALARIHPNFTILAIMAASLDGNEIPGRFQVLFKPFALDTFVDCVDSLLEQSARVDQGVPQLPSREKI